jgi:hypothetical protein
MLMVSDRTIRNWLEDKDLAVISDERVDGVEVVRCSPDVEMLQRFCCLQKRL